MSEEKILPVLNDNTDLKQFELTTEGFVSKIEYMLIGNKIILTHTEVPIELEGKGTGSLLVKLTLEEIAKRNLLLIPLCPFVASYIKRHPEWMKLLDKDVNLK